MSVTVEAPRVLNSESLSVNTRAFWCKSEDMCRTHSALFLVDSFSRSCSAPRLLEPEVCTGTGVCSLCSSLPALCPFLTLIPLIGLTQFGASDTDYWFSLGNLCIWEKKILQTILLITEKYLDLCYLSYLLSNQVIYLFTLWQTSQFSLSFYLATYP